MLDHQPPEIDKPLSHSDMAQVVDQWHAEYIDIPQEELFELVMAANYLDIKPLLELSCAKVASQIKNKSIQEIRKYFSIENDFTPEEEAQIAEENRWAEESFWDNWKEILRILKAVMITKQVTFIVIYGLKFSLNVKFL